MSRNDGAKTTADPASRRPGPPRWFWYLWGALFFGLGCVFLYGLGVRPLWGVVRAADWVETPCTVVSSRLKENPSTDAETPGPTYSVEVVYRYDYGGRTYQSDRYDFVRMSSNTGLAKKRRIVRAHPPGRQTVCFVNPDDPSEAVLERGLTAEMWWGLFPIPFVVIGAAGLGYAIFSRRRPRFGRGAA